MKKRIENMTELQKAIDNEETIVTKDGYAPDLRTMIPCTLSGEIVGELYAEEPDPEPPWYVYRRLDWDGFYPMVQVGDGTCPISAGLPAQIGLGHWENGKEYRLVGFMNIKSDEKGDDKQPYYRSTGKARYARFELQKETD